MAAKLCAAVGASVTDEDYKGRVSVVPFNFGKKKLEVKRKKRLKHSSLVNGYFNLTQTSNTHDTDGAQEVSAAQEKLRICLHYCDVSVHRTANSHGVSCSGTQIRRPAVITLQRLGSLWLMAACKSAL